jgi:hypothetical protein
MKLIITANCDESEIRLSHQWRQILTAAQARVYDTARAIWFGEIEVDSVEEFARSAGVGPAHFGECINALQDYGLADWTVR